MILTGKEIAKEVLAGRIVIDPFTTSQVQPNSYDTLRTAIIDDSPVIVGLGSSTIET